MRLLAPRKGVKQMGESCDFWTTVLKVLNVMELMEVREARRTLEVQRLGDLASTQADSIS